MKMAHFRPLPTGGCNGKGYPERTNFHDAPCFRNSTARPRAAIGRRERSHAWRRALARRPKRHSSSEQSSAHCAVTSRATLAAGSRAARRSSAPLTSATAPSRRLCDQSGCFLTLPVHDHRMQKMSAQPLDILRQPREDTLDYVALTHQLSDDATIQLTAIRQR